MTTDNGLIIDAAALAGLSNLLLDRAGLKITPDGYHGLKLALEARLPATGMVNGNDYVRKLRSPEGESELRALLPMVTVGKTDFFRDGRQFLALERRVIPQLMSQARREKRNVTVWSAGCATGEEPYSLAMVAEECGATIEEVSILATDLNPKAVEFARDGLYPLRRMGGVSESRARRFFDLTDAGYQVVPQLQHRVTFLQNNLAAKDTPVAAAASKDLILCRNVIIYFDQLTIRQVMDRFYETLRPGGYLFLGYSESLFRITTKFEMTEIEGSFIYRRPLVDPPKEHAKPVKAPQPLGTPMTLPRRPTTDTFRVPSEVLEQARAAKLKPGPQSPVERLETVVRLLEKGSFDDALPVAIELTKDHPEDLAALLTLGNLYALMKKADQARLCFERALKMEPLCVEARIYLGISHLQEGDWAGARSEFQKVIFLEPTLVLAHYLLAQACEQQGDMEKARRSYKNAMQNRKASFRTLVGHFPELPQSSQAIMDAAQYRLLALSEK